MDKKERKKKTSLLNRRNLPQGHQNHRGVKPQMKKRSNRRTSLMVGYPTLKPLKRMTSREVGIVAVT